FLEATTPDVQRFDSPLPDYTVLADCTPLTAYLDLDCAKARTTLAKLIAALGENVPDALPELAELGRTLTERATDVLVFFNRPGTSNGPTEAINGRLEHLCGSALGFRDLAHCIAAASSY